MQSIRPCRCGLKTELICLWDSGVCDTDVLQGSMCRDRFYYNEGYQALESFSRQERVLAEPSLHPILNGF